MSTITYYVHQTTLGDPKYQRFRRILMSWLNQHLREDRVYVRDIVEDLHDGQLLVLFLEKTLQVAIHSDPTGPVSDRGKRGNLAVVLRFLRERVGLEMSPDIIDGILNKDVVSICRLLVAMAHEFRCPYQLPSNLEISVVRRETQHSGTTLQKTQRHTITEDESAWGSNEATTALTDVESRKTLDSTERVFERDAFDELLDPGAEAKLASVQRLLFLFVNKHLAPLDVTVTPGVGMHSTGETGSDIPGGDIAVPFHDGLYLLLLIGSLGGFYIPPSQYHSTPTTADQKIHNVQLALDLMERLEITPGAWHAQAIVTQDARVTMRVLYALHTAFKNTVTQ
ncbi:hypothetical protein H696_01541 [Fonticula alba]|uniref:Calponin-homology (CH) domain-containing protein n=1 Tax=Fonticula alba TaxID=691883 RepID=A0A058ZCJ6_FONAL|nr:hypothetical protein H696_01541 [Fonticula alba]KCV72135.1 hypothetical protein H696_01541 [Fonticula alba]|eukprot:XP_009493713.1 hypothetical protein H696_01541 [Fonticula alba]